MKPKPCRKDWL